MLFRSIEESERRGKVTHVLEEHLQDAARLLVDEARDTLHASTSGEATDGWLCDTCRAVSEVFQNIKSFARYLP